MDPVYFILLLTLALPIIWAIGSAITTSGVQSKFGGMGTIAGRTKDDVLSIVGPPNSISSLGEGVTLLQWQSPGYHIALKFTNDICDGVTHEHSA